MNRLMILISLISLSVISCEKEKGNNNLNTEKIVFHGITMTDEFGNIILRDTNNWKLFENWTEKENLLFNEKMESYCSTENNNYFIISAPNPCDGFLNLYLIKPPECRLAFRIVDRDYKVLVSHDSIYSNSVALALNDFNISDDTVRIYYKILEQDCELKGHGDIKIE